MPADHFATIYRVGLPDEHSAQYYIFIDTALTILDYEKISREVFSCAGLQDPLVERIISIPDEI
ncbi:MAG: hypothetical protein ABH879_09390 [archaeon]